MCLVRRHRRQVQNETSSMNAPTRLAIRSALFPDDRATVEELFCEYVGRIGIDLAFQNFNEELAGLPGKYAPPAGRILLAYFGALPAGCVALRPLSAGSCEMKRLYVRPVLRGEGIGRRLIQRALNDAREAGYSQIYVDTLPSMREAQTLYESFGFRDSAPYCHNPLPEARFLVMDLKRLPTSSALQSVNLQEKFGRFSDYWNPKIVGELNGQQVKLVKCRGEFIWHKHDNEDELFLVVKGRLRIDLRDREVWVDEGEFLIVPRGVEHRPVAVEDVHVILFEPVATLNTGNVQSDCTIAQPERL